MPCIYALADPDTGEVRYIGKANDANKRLLSHMRTMHRKDYPVYRWMRKLGKAPAIVVLRCVGVDAWPEAEREEIAKARAAGSRLLNATDGGNQPQPTSAQCAAAARAAVRAREATPYRKRVNEYIRKMGTARAYMMAHKDYARAYRCRFMQGLARSLLV